MEIKPGVRLLGIRPELVVALMVLREIYVTHGEFKQFVLTSCIDGTHSAGSLHYAGCAVDLRLPAAYAAAIVADAKKALGPDFDVVLESNHIHVEYDPKTPY